MVQLNRRWAPHWSQDNPSYMTTPLWHFLSTLRCPTFNFISTSSLHSFSTSPLYIVNWPAPLWHSLLHINSKLFLYLLSTPPSYIPSLHTPQCKILYDDPPLTLLFWTLTLNFIFTSSLHPLSTSTLYILYTQHCRILSWYSSIAAGLRTGHKTTHPVCLPPLTLPLYTPMSNF